MFIFLYTFKALCVFSYVCALNSVCFLWRVNCFIFGILILQTEINFTVCTCSVQFWKNYVGCNHIYMTRSVVAVGFEFLWFDVNVIFCTELYFWHMLLTRIYGMHFQLSACLFIYLCVCLLTSLPIPPSGYVCRSTCLSVHLCMCLCICWKWYAVSAQ
jgi:hypothetical protein